MAKREADRNKRIHAGVIGGFGGFFKGGGRGAVGGASASAGAGGGVVNRTATSLLCKARPYRYNDY